MSKDGTSESKAFHWEIRLTSHEVTETMYLAYNFPQALFCSSSSLINDNSHLSYYFLYRRTVFPGKMQKKQKVVNKLAESHKLLTKIKLRAPLRNVFHPLIKNFFLEISYFFLKKGVLFFFNNLDFFLLAM